MRELTEGVVVSSWVLVNCKPLLRPTAEKEPRAVVEDFYEAGGSAMKPMSLLHAPTYTTNGGTSLHKTETDGRTTSALCWPCWPA